MNIAIDIRSLMEGRHSGVEEYTTNIVHALARVAPQHTYQLFYNSATAAKLPALPYLCVIRSFRYPNVIFNALQWVASQPRWDSLVKADVFFVPSPRLIPISHDVPLVSVAHDVSYRLFPEFLTIRRRMWHHIMRPGHVFAQSDHVIAVSERTRRDVIRVHGVRPDRVSVVHSGVSGMSDVAMRDVIRVQHRYKLPGAYFLFLGTHEPRKNISGIVAAFDAIADTVPHHLVLAGERGWREGDIHRAVNNSRAKSRVHVINFVPEKDKHAIMAGADVFVYPSIYEGFGFPPLEALLAGTPVITSFNSALPEVVGQWAHLVDPYNVSEIAGVMQELAHKPYRVPQNIRADIQQTYSWDAAASHVLDIFENSI